jgi:hypothetical protein
MKKNEWHIHFNENMTRLSKAQEQLKVAPRNSIEFHEANKQVRARMHELDCLNSANTLIEPPDEVGIKTTVAPAFSFAPGRKPLISLPDLAPHPDDLRPRFHAAAEINLSRIP